MRKLLLKRKVGLCGLVTFVSSLESKYGLCGIWTRVNTVKMYYPNQLDEEKRNKMNASGLEPETLRLKGGCSTGWAMRKKKNLEKFQKKKLHKRIDVVKKKVTLSKNIIIADIKKNEKKIVIKLRNKLLK